VIQAHGWRCGMRSSVSAPMRHLTRVLAIVLTSTTAGGKSPA
jgi:hypothetical protein